jgi:hypothetical protein
MHAHATAHLAGVGEGGGCAKAEAQRRRNADRESM